VLGRLATKVGDKTKAGAGTIAQANKQLEADGLPPLPLKLTPHSLRRTFCSLLYALGEDPGTVMDEMGHTDSELALRVYRQAMRRGEQEKAQLKALVEGGVLANSGQREEIEAAGRLEASRLAAKTAYLQAISERARQDSNLRPLAPEASALSTELRARKHDSTGRSLCRSRGGWYR
jgi:hypothetical protein